jgi:hypothetical protein
LIIYRKTPSLRIKRATVPEPPFWCATTIAPYSSRRGDPVAIDYLDLAASSSERLEVTVCDRVVPELERATRLRDPVFIEASEFAERIFRRGDETLAFCSQEQRSVVHLVSTRGTLPQKAGSDATVVIAAWPLDLDRLGTLFAEAGQQMPHWGVAVPVIFPVTTDLDALGRLADLAARHGASFLAAIAIEADPTARSSLARVLGLGDEDESYALLFHADPEPLQIATERHLAALAEERGMADFIVPPRFSEKSNWNAAVVLTLTAARLIAMQHDVELAGALARSARLVAELEKPIERIASAASLSIIEALDEASVDIVTEWLESGRSSYVERINREWRLRRDYGVDLES